MDTLILVYGIAKGETKRYMEQLLSSRCKTPAEIELVKQAAAKDGFQQAKTASLNFRNLSQGGNPQ